MSRWHRLEGVPDLPDHAFSPDPLGRITLEGGGSGQTEATTYTSNLPEYAQPYYEDLMQRAHEESLKGYTPYAGERVAGFTPSQQAVRADILGLQTPGQFGAATGYTEAATQAAAGSQYDPTQFTSETFTPEAAAYYMSPYQQQVIDVRKREAQRQGDIQAQQDAYAAEQARAFGGSRHGVVEAEAQRNLQQQLEDIQATGQQQAYEQAAQQFGADRAAAAEAAAQTEASKQFGAQYGQAALQQQLAGAQQLAGLGEAQQKLDMARQQMQSATTAEEQQLAQKQLDQAYQDFVNARDYERQQLAYFNALMRGIPVPVQQEVIGYQPNPNPISQLTGAGIAGLQLDKLMS